MESFTVGLLAKMLGYSMNVWKSVSLLKEISVFVFAGLRFPFG